MNEFQKRIKKFARERDWEKFHNPKDLLLGIIEEVGELRNIVKWEQNPQKLKEALLKNKESVKDDIGDIYWFLALLANAAEIDINKAVEGVIKSNEKRFPISKVKSVHTNRYIRKGKNYG